MTATYVYEYSLVNEIVRYFILEHKYVSKYSALTEELGDFVGLFEGLAVGEALGAFDGLFEGLVLG